jgi:hypothetical protein
MLETACKQNVAKCGSYDIGKLSRFWSNKELEEGIYLQNVQTLALLFSCQIDSKKIFRVAEDDLIMS